MLPAVTPAPAPPPLPPLCDVVGQSAARAYVCERSHPFPWLSSPVNQMDQPASHSPGQQRGRVADADANLAERLLRQEGLEAQLDHLHAIRIVKRHESGC